MATIIKNMGQLNQILESRLVKAMKMTRDTIFEVATSKLLEYYEEPVFNGSSEPKVYQRTYELMSAPKSSDIKNIGNGYQFTVGFDDEYLTFRYSGGATGIQVLEWYNSESHGGTVPGSHKFWDETLEQLGNKIGILNLFRENCRKCGIPIK